MRYTVEAEVTDVDRQAYAGRRSQVVHPADFYVGVRPPTPAVLDARAVRWSVTREPSRFSPAGFPGFVFQGDDASRLAGQVAGGEGRLDGAGRRRIDFRPEHPAAAGPMRYTVEAEVTDVDRQAYAGRRSQVVHPADFYVGVRPPTRAVLEAGDRLEVPLVAVAPDGSATPGVRARARLVRVDHHQTARLAGSTAQTLNREVTTDAATCEVITGDGPSTCAFDVPAAGAWRVVAWARDGRGRDVTSGFSFTAAGANSAAWPRFDRERIELTRDRPSYAPGDVARLVVQSPFEEATGLLTIERGGVLRHEVVQIRGDTPVIEIPITEEMAPNAYASIALIRGRAHDLVDATGFETGAPAFRLGVAELAVEPIAQTLTVEVTPDAARAEPGAPLAVDVSLRDAEGHLSGGQVAVMVVDEAILGLTAYATPDPVAALYPEAPLGVRTADSRLELPHARRARREVLFPGGDGADVVDSGLPADLLRDLFEATAWYDPAVPVGEDGVARVAFDLPDNTTTWRVMAVAVDERGRAGSGDAQVVVSQPLMVQAVLPRFAYPGDALPVEAILHNRTEEDGVVTVALEVAGLSATDGAIREGVPVPAGGTASVSFPVHVTRRPGEATVRFLARLGEHADAVEVPLPVLEPGAARAQVTEAQVSREGALSLRLPEDRVPGTESLEVVVSTTSLTALKDAVGYLMGYPNGCIEQTTSRAYPLVMLEDLLPEIGVDVDRDKLHEYATAGVERILSFQTGGGGLSYWPGSDQPHAFATAFGLTALIEARQKGYDVPDEALEGMADYLEDALTRGDVTESIPHGKIADGDTRALFVMTLGRLGRPQPAYLSHLWGERDKLTGFGLSFLGIAAAELDADHPLVDPILAALQERATEEAQAAWYEGQAKGGYSMDSPLRTHASALLAYATGKAGDDMSAKLLSGLLDRRRGGLWGNTQENVFGIMGVHALAGRPDVAGDAPRFALTVNGEAVDPDAMSAPSARVRRLTLGPDALGASEQAVALEGVVGAPINVTLRAAYDVALTPENRAARANGASLTRSYATLEGAPLDAGAIPLGGLVAVTLTLETDEALNYVAVADLLPAGLEPLNQALATTAAVDAGALTPALSRGLEALSYQEIRDHRVAFYADALPAGEHAFRYIARASTPGTFLRPAADMEAMYRTEINAATAIDEVTVR